VLAPGLVEGSRPLVTEHLDANRVSFNRLRFALWSLSRDEEAAIEERDNHGRLGGRRSKYSLYLFLGNAGGAPRARAPA
jgi:hypothetical protein